MIAAGKKTATCSLLAAWQADAEPLPAVGRLTVVLNWAQVPVCIIRTTDVALCPFNQVPVDFAIAEGEGDDTYQWWYAAHDKFFTEQAKQLDIEFSADAMLVLKRFGKVYP